MNTESQKAGSTSASRITTVASSLRCYVYSLIGLVPLIGIPFAFTAIIKSRQVPAASGAEWNPADRYLKAARRLGPVGFVTNAAFILLLGVVLPAFWRDAVGCYSGST